MELSRAKAQDTAGFWEAVGTALAALAKRTGCSFRESPLPEIREVAEDLTDWQQQRANR